MFYASLLKRDKHVRRKNERTTERRRNEEPTERALEQIK